MTLDKWHHHCATKRSPSSCYAGQVKGRLLLTSDTLHFTVYTKTPCLQIYSLNLCGFRKGPVLKKISKQKNRKNALISMCINSLMKSSYFVCSSWHSHSRKGQRSCSMHAGIWMSSIASWPSCVQSFNQMSLNTFFIMLA